MPLPNWNNISSREKWQIRIALAAAMERQGNLPAKPNELELIASRLLDARVQTMARLAVKDLCNSDIAGLELSHARREASARQERRIYESHNQPPSFFGGLDHERWAGGK
ncbi:MAG: hypothetical protein AAGA67_02090 [Cyanobacteria bacterium P01_F01_bin.153]